MTEATDIEIYIANTSAESLKTWLADQLDAVEPAKRQAGMPQNAIAMTGHWHGQAFSILVLERVVGRFTSLWLNSNDLPWLDDPACARAASAHFNQEARISAGGWTESDDPDAWVQIIPDGTETAINWKTG
ncbi:hypothetical protein [Saccharospirillum sp.]|uniref:hypothetical protein n=1 Tax=Saccharospirillum sp. TaxID=2033801 RepID=UPI0034A01C25